MSNNNGCGAVRIATLADQEELMQMLPDFAKENGIKDSSGRPIPFDRDRAQMTLLHALAPIPPKPDVNSPGGIVGIIGEPGKLEASIGIGLQYPWYSSAPYLMEIWNYVRPR